LTKGSARHHLKLSSVDEFGGAALAMSIQGSEDSLRYVVYLAEATDLDKQAARSVDLQQRLSLLSIDL
jgi:hypothetical protein